MRSHWSPSLISQLSNRAGKETDIFRILPLGCRGTKNEIEVLSIASPVSFCSMYLLQSTPTGSFKRFLLAETIEAALVTSYRKDISYTDDREDGNGGSLANGTYG